MLRSHSKSVSHVTAHNNVKVGDQAVGPDGNFGTVLALMGDHALCLFDPPCKRLPFKKRLSLTQQQLERLNNESIRLGFRANLWENTVAALPHHLRFKIAKVYRHEDANGHSNIRLAVRVGPSANDLREVLLDVTPDAWAEIQKTCRLSQ